VDQQCDAASYALEALRQVGAKHHLTGHGSPRHRDRRRLAVVALCLGRGDAAAQDSMSRAVPGDHRHLGTRDRILGQCARAVRRNGIDKTSSVRSQPAPTSTPLWCITTSAPSSALSLPAVRIPIDPDAGDRTVA